MNFTIRTLTLLTTLASTLCCGQMRGMEGGAQKRQWESDLIQAVRENNSKLVRALLADKKGDINAYDENGWTALYNAIERGASIGIVRKFLRAGADANKKTGEVIFRYPIHAAIEKGRVGTLHSLVNHKADINAKDGIGNTPLSLASKLDRPNCVKFLRSQGAK